MTLASIPIMTSFSEILSAIRGKTYVQVATAEYLEATIRAGHPGTLMPAWDRKPED